MKFSHQNSTLRIFIASVLSLLVLGCANQYPNSISQNVNEKITVKDIQNGLKPDQSTLIRWGGVIAQINNHEKNTWLEVVQLPLNNQGVPLNSDKTSGRFLVRIEKFLDPAIYAKGRAFTVVGNLKGVTKGKIGEHQYQYPVVEASGFQLWPQKKDVVYTTLYYPLGFWSPFYSSFYYHYDSYDRYPRSQPRRSHQNESRPPVNSSSGSRIRQIQPRPRSVPNVEREK